ncbi:DUF3274 domain-containing protein [Gilliamella sp. BG2]|uniref:T6SS effector phospholipase Tle3 domain-containing protein n=1 Tax=Gilliamella sp. BG2 TaxID=3351509 RepID=UPI003987CBEF
MSNTHTSDDSITEVDGVIGLPSNSTDAMLTQNVCVPAPLPCIVILIHGVNDIGEAFENQDQAICNGLNKRLGRTDLTPNEWHTIQTDADNFAPRIAIKKSNYSPIVPFFWGYRPVDKEKYHEEQLAYEKRLKDASITDPELPYDSYWIDKDFQLDAGTVAFNKLNCDKFNNWIDYGYHRNGGPFANATTCIPDMYGPGMAGILAEGGKIATPPGSKSYNNPHRIYFAFAAHRLANLIKQIRKDTKDQDIPINIVAHSQGTIITMLATFLLAKENVLPADCVILAHSPYAFEPAIAEVLSKDLLMGVQSKEGREETFINFVNVIKESQGLRNKEFNPEILKQNGVISTAVNPDEKYVQADDTVKQYDRLGKDEQLFYRNNFGKVYNYFSPNDRVVSLWNVQGMGWQGIPDHIIHACQDNLKQRIFAQHVIVGNDTQNKKFNIPLIKFELTQQQYPDYISMEDYNQRVTFINFRGKKVPSSVVLLPEQLEKLKQEPLFKEVKGTLEHGNYYDSGRKVAIFYKPSLAETQKDHPEWIYKKTTSKQVESICLDKEKKSSNGKSSGIILRKNVPDSLLVAIKQCKQYQTGDVQTAPFWSTERIINGEEVPETMIYTVDDPTGKTKLSRTVHYNDIYHVKPEQLEELKQRTYETKIQRPNYIPPITNPYDIIGQPLITDEILLQKLNDDLQLSDRGIKGFRYIGNSDMGKDKDEIKVYYYLSQQQFQEAIGDLVDSEADVSSHHSGITNSKEAPAKIMAYDLAIGIVKDITPKKQQKLYEWRALADWRHPENTDKETTQYVRYGLLPPDLKKAMHYPDKHMPIGDNFVENSFYHGSIRPNHSAVVSISIEVNRGIELSKEKYKKLSKAAQWLMPEPDLKES